MKHIRLSNGMFAQVDEQDFEYLNQFKWSVNSNGYAYRNIRINGKRTTILMHREIFREILNAPKGIECDHIDGNKLNDQRSNLRLANRSENQYNRPANRNSASGVKGVSWDRHKKKWRVRIQANGKQHWLGLFESLLEAARAYNEAALRLHKDFACLNDLEAIANIAGSRVHAIADGVSNTCELYN